MERALAGARLATMESAHARQQLMDITRGFALAPNVDEEFASLSTVHWEVEGALALHLATVHSFVK